MRYKISHALVQFGGDVILRDVNFEVHDKEKIAIVGRNGRRRDRFHSGPLRLWKDHAAASDRGRYFDE